MGSFSIWHWLMGGPVLLLLAVIGIVLYFVLRKRPPATQGLAVQGEGAEMSAAPVARTTAQKVISVGYLVGGAFGVITTLPQLNGLSLDLLSALAWLILLAQIAAALYGGWQYWQGRPVGAQALYWLSWSCVPVISSSMLTYWCAIGVGAFPAIAIAGGISIDFSFRFGYASQLWFLPDVSGLLVGANLVALACAVVLGKTLKAAGVPPWPLALKAA